MHTLVIKRHLSFDLAVSSRARRFGMRSPISIKAPDSILSTSPGGTGGIAVPPPLESVVTISNG